MELDVPANMVEINYAFSECINLERVTFRENSQIQSMLGAFSSCTKLTSINLPDGLAVVSGFAGCKALISITIPDSVTKIDNSCFSNCINLETVILSENSRLETIDNAAFYNCKKLEDFTLPVSLDWIGEIAFAGTTNINFDRTMYFRGTMDEWKAIGKHTHWSQFCNIILICSDGTLENE